MGKHVCHNRACRRPCPPRWLMCKRCWGLVHPSTQRDVYETVAKRGPSVDASWAPWWRAQASAILEAQQKGAAMFWWQEAKPGAFFAAFKHDLRFANYLDGTISREEYLRQEEEAAGRIPETRTPTHRGQLLVVL